MVAIVTLALSKKDHAKLDFTTQTQVKKLFIHVLNAHLVLSVQLQEQVRLMALV